MILTGISVLAMLTICHMNTAFAGEQKVVVRKGVFVDNLIHGRFLEKIPAALDIVVDETWGRVASILWEPRLSLPHYDIDQKLERESTLPALSESWSYYGKRYPTYNKNDQVAYERTDDDMELGIVVGMRFRFKKFDFNSFRRCMKNNLERREAKKGMPSVVFYFDIP
jgi:hypothetical protein